MSAPAFTPGRWSARPGLDPWRWVVVADGKFPGGGAVAETDHRDAHTPEVNDERRVAAVQTRGDLASVPECAANARLIAAAPDLYAALRDLLDNENSYAPPYEGADGQWICECGRFEASDEPQSCAHTRARAALAKAAP